MIDMTELCKGLIFSMNRLSGVFIFSLGVVSSSISDCPFLGNIIG